MESRSTWAIVAFLLLVSPVAIAFPSSAAEEKGGEDKTLTELRAEESALAKQLEELRARIKNLEASSASAPAASGDWPFLGKVIGSRFEVNGGAPLRHGPTTESEQVAYMSYSDVVTVLSYGGNAWWRVRVACERHRSPGDAALPCEIEGYVHHSALESAFRRAEVVVPQEFLFPEAEAPRQVKLGNLTLLAPHYYAEAIWMVKDADSGVWDLLGAVGEGSSAEYKVRRGSILGWVKSYSIEEPKSFDVEPYLYALRKRYQDAEEAIRKKYPDLLVHSVSPSLPNSAGGIDVNLVFEVMNGKTVKYLQLEVSAFNAVGDRVLKTSPGDPTGRLRYTGPVQKSDGLESASWETVWYNSTISCVRVDKIRVEYLDGSSATYIKDLPMIFHPDFSNKCGIQAGIGF